MAKEYAEAWKDIPMLAKTHGQPASPHSSGKRNDGLRLPPRTTAERLKNRFLSAENSEGPPATSTLTTWLIRNMIGKISELGFLQEKLGIEREAWTTQISNYDNLAALLHGPSSPCSSAWAAACPVSWLPVPSKMNATAG